MSITRKAEDRLQARSAFGQVFTHIPEPEQSHAEAQAPIKLVILKQPVKRGTEVVDLEIASGQPCASVLRVQFWIPFFRQYKTIRGMGAPQCRFLPARRNTFQ